MAQSASLSAEFEAFAAEKVKSGHYADAREVLEAAKAALERKERYQEKLAYLRQTIAEGDASGIAEEGVFARIRERAGLPQRVRA